jgi:hypothetical protein
MSPPSDGSSQLTMPPATPVTPPAKLTLALAGGRLDEADGTDEGDEAIKGLGELATDARCVGAWVRAGAALVDAPAQAASAIANTAAARSQRALGRILILRGSPVIEADRPVADGAAFVFLPGAA